MDPTHLFFILIALPSALATDRAALLRFRDSVGGRTLRWNLSAALCSWEGVTCSGGGSINRVTELRLPGDGLTGDLPTGTMGNLSELRVLSLRGNSLSGQLPSDIALCTQLRGLHLQWNNFSGEIPTVFFTLTNLRHLNLAGNRFSGNLPPAFVGLTGLRILRLENNRFTGSTLHFSQLNKLTDFNVSFNGLNGSIPSELGNKFNSSSFLGTALCGRPLVPCSDDGNRLSGGAIAGIAVGSTLTLLLILVIALISRSKLRSRKIDPQVHLSPAQSSPENSQSINPNYPSSDAEHYSNPSSLIPHHKTATNRAGSDGLAFFGDDVETFGLEALLKASAEMIGNGTVGSTYKAYLDSGVEVVVKRLKNSCLPEESFRAKIEEVGSLVHDNLEPLRGYFYGRDEKLLFYEPMQIGSLSGILHGNLPQGNRTKGLLSWKIRAKIALLVARGIEYLHSIGPGMAHGNIKSSNVFLTDNYDSARVSEFGLVQLVSSISSLSGYRAPEVVDTRQLTQEADVYSFGVLILELVTGKDPDRAVAEEGVHLPTWVQSVSPNRWGDEVLEPELVGIGSSEEIVQFLDLALSCTTLDPYRRPPVAEVAHRIEEFTIQCSKDFLFKPL